MYGYVFAAAEVGVTHRVRRDVMLYPGYVPYMGRGPNILHYGSDVRADPNHDPHSYLDPDPHPNPNPNPPKP